MQLYLACREVFPERNSYKVEMQGPAQRWLQRGLWRNECRDLRMKAQLSLLKILAGGSALDKQNFCNNWSLPTHGGSFWNPSSTTPTDRKKKNTREGHRKPLDGRTNSRPFRSKSQTDFATAKMSAEITAKVFVTRKPAWTKIVVDT